MATKRKADCTPEEWARQMEKSRERHARWRAENPEKAREHSRKWAAANPEKAKAAKAKSRVKRKEEDRAYQALRRESGKGAEASRRWRENNIEKAREQARERSRKIRKATAPSVFRDRLRNAREKIADWYAAKVLKVPLAQVTPELLALKREQLMLRRLTKQLETTLKEVNHE